MMSPQRQAIESQYTGKGTITEYIAKTDSITKLTKHTEKDVLKDEPCRVSYKNITVSNSTNTGTITKQIIKLFIAPELDIKPGSKITVTQNGVTTVYKNSGKAGVYDSHQEVILELFDGWA